MIDIELLRYVRFLTTELIAACPVDTHNMQNSIKAININDNVVDIVIPVKYAAAVNYGKEAGGNSDKNKHWVEDTIARASKCYSRNYNDDDYRMGITSNISAMLGEGEK